MFICLFLWRIITKLLLKDMQILLAAKSNAGFTEMDIAICCYKSRSVGAAVVLWATGADANCWRAQAPKRGPQNPRWPPLQWYGGTGRSCVAWNRGSAAVEKILAAAPTHWDPIPLSSPWTVFSISLNSHQLNSWHMLKEILWRQGMARQPAYREFSKKKSLTSSGFPVHPKAVGVIAFYGLAGTLRVALMCN